MLNDFLNTIKGELVTRLSDKTDLDSDKSESASVVVVDTLKEGLLDKFKGGKLDDIVSMLGSNGASSPMANNIVTDTIEKLVSKVGISKEMANKVATFTVPFVVNKMGSFASSKGKDNKEGIKDLLGDLLKNSAKDKLIGGLGKKFGF
jgi:uncharacterized protein YidB (DUF937 family)